jgi:hypothetical protein
MMVMVMLIHVMTRIFCFLFFLMMFFMACIRRVFCLMVGVRMGVRIQIYLMMVSIAPTGVYQVGKCRTV